MKIIIADSSPLFRNGLNLCLQKMFTAAKVEQLSGFSEIINTLNLQNDISLIILDVDLRDLPWHESLIKIRQLAKNSKIVVISSSEDILTIKRIISAGTNGYILKTAEMSEIEDALKRILSGETYIPQTLPHSMRLTGTSGRNSGLKNLTNRQSQVLDLIAQGKSNKQIAYDMGVSESTVKLHINALLRTLHVSNRTQAVVTAQKMGII